MPKLNSYYYRLVREFEEAVRSDEMKGAQPPEDREEIEERLERKKALLINYVRKL